MASDPHEHHAATGPPPAANLGLVRPPLVYGGALVLGLVLQWIHPIAWIRPALGAWAGAAFVLAAAGLFFSSVRTFSAAGTPVPGNRPTTAIVRRGPYRFSRNPIYLAFSLLLLGLALWVDAAWLLLTLAFAAGLMNCVVIPREERYLETRFPAEYPPYKASVRRWL